MRASILCTAVAVALTILFVGAPSCTHESHGATQYTGPAPSPAWQSVLHGLGGQRLPQSKLGRPGDELLVEAFFVSANPITGIGPIVTLVTPAAVGRPFDVKAPQGADGRWILPVITDGDAADFVHRVTGQSSDTAAGETSATYRQIIDGR